MATVIHVTVLSGFGLLTANRESLSVTDPAIASDFLQLLDVQGGISSEITLYRVLFVDHGSDSSHLVIGQITNASVRIDFSLGKNVVRTYSTDSVDVRKSDLDTFLSR